MSNASNKCPCHSEKSYEMCCAPYHQGKSPPTALALMRSRYSAYARGDVDYILKTQTTDSEIPLDVRHKQIEQFCQQTTFRGLEILEFVDAEPFSYVTFKAELSQGGKDVSFTEKSRFEKVADRWCYVGICGK